MWNCPAQGFPQCSGLAFAISQAPTQPPDSVCRMGVENMEKKWELKGSWVKVKLTFSLAQIPSFTPDFCTHFLPHTTSGQWVCCGDDWNQLCPAWDSPTIPEKNYKHVVKLSLPDNVGFETW